MTMASKLMSMRSQNNGNWLFFEERNNKVFYSLVAHNGDLKEGRNEHF